jgi:hypothetical protein
MNDTRTQLVRDLPNNSLATCAVVKNQQQRPQEQRYHEQHKLQLICDELSATGSDEFIRMK